MTRPQRSVALRRTVVADAYVLARRLLGVADEIDRLLPAINALADEIDPPIPDPEPDDFDHEAAFSASVEGASWDLAGCLGSLHHEPLRDAARRFVARIDRLTWPG